MAPLPFPKRFIPEDVSRLLELKPELEGEIATDEKLGV